MSRYNKLVKNLLPKKNITIIDFEIKIPNDLPIEKEKIVKKKKVNQMPSLTPEQQEEINNIVDWHEYIDPPIISTEEE